MRIDGKGGIRIATGLVTALCAIACSASAREQVGQNWYRVNIDLSSQVPMPPALLRESQETVTTIFTKIRVHLTWTGPLQHEVAGCVGEPATSDLAVEIVPHAPVTSSDYALAQARPYADSGARIVIFYDRVEMLYGYHASHATILGYVLAHEIAHVLQGVARHSETGIMRACWMDKDFTLYGSGAAALH